MVGGALGSMVAPGIGTALGLAARLHGRRPVRVRGRGRGSRAGRVRTPPAGSSAGDQGRGERGVCAAGLPPHEVAHQSVVSAAEHVAPGVIPLLVGSNGFDQAAYEPEHGHQHPGRHEHHGHHGHGHWVRAATGSSSTASDRSLRGRHRDRTLDARAGGAGPADAPGPRQAVRAAGDDAAGGGAVAGRAGRDRAVPDRQPLRAASARCSRYLRWLRARPGEHHPGRDAAPLHDRPAALQRRADAVRPVLRGRSRSAASTRPASGCPGSTCCATDALASRATTSTQPPVVCYLARGPGAAIRRARTRLPGGGQNPVAIIRVPRERMIGHGIASSLVHEVGHQGAALLDLVESLRVSCTRGVRASAGARARGVGARGSGGSRRSSPTSGRSPSSGSARRSG